MDRSTRRQAIPGSNDRTRDVGRRAAIPRTMLLAMLLFPVLHAHPCDAGSAPMQLAQAAKGSSAAPDAAKKPAEMSFAYANQAGTALLAVDDPDPILDARLDRAICDDGRIITVRFTGMQKQAKRSTGRNDAENFNAAAGPRFRTAGVKGSPVCLIAKREFLAGKRILPITRQTPTDAKHPCDPGLRDRIPLLENRPLTECTSVASIGTDAELVAALYAPQGDNLLAALVVLTKTAIFINPLPAQEGTWRVDDEGDLHPEAIIPIFALATADGAIEIALDWEGAEGHDLTLYKTSPPGALAEVLTGYLYTAPQ
jgi:hypothetical protein